MKDWIPKPKDNLQPSPGSVLLPQNDALVAFVHLFKEDEGEDRVGPEPHVVGREALPEREETLLPHHLPQHVKGARVLGFAVNDLHVLDSAFEFKIYYYSTY